MTSGYDMVPWTEANFASLPDMASGLSKVLVSYYETDNDNIRPTLAEWTTLFQSLATIFPNASLGFGEVGMDKPATSATLSQAESIMTYYYTLRPGVPSWWGGYFWWNAQEDSGPGHLPAVPPAGLARVSAVLWYNPLMPMQAMPRGTAATCRRRGASLGPVCAAALLASACASSAPPPAPAPPVIARTVSAIVLVNHCAALGPANARLAEKAINQLVDGCSSLPGGASASRRLSCRGARCSSSRAVTGPS